MCSYPWSVSDRNRRFTGIHANAMKAAKFTPIGVTQWISLASDGLNEGSQLASRKLLCAVSEVYLDFEAFNFEDFPFAHFNLELGTELQNSTKN